jgi:hypothetical protein
VCGQKRVYEGPGLNDLSKVRQVLWSDGQERVKGLKIQMNIYALAY